MLLRIGRLTGGFNTSPVLAGVGLRMRAESEVTLMKHGNTKGSALLGVVTKRVACSSNRVVGPGRMAVNCLTRGANLRSRLSV